MRARAWRLVGCMTRQNDTAHRRLISRLSFNRVTCPSYYFIYWSVAQQVYFRTLAIAAAVAAAAVTHPPRYTARLARLYPDISRRTIPLTSVWGCSSVDTSRLKKKKEKKTSKQFSRNITHIVVYISHIVSAFRFKRGSDAVFEQWQKSRGECFNLHEEFFLMFIWFRCCKKKECRKKAFSVH